MSHLTHVTFRYQFMGFSIRGLGGGGGGGGGDNALAFVSYIILLSTVNYTARVH